MEFHKVSCHFMPFHTVSCSFVPLHSVPFNFQTFRNFSWRFILAASAATSKTLRQLARHLWNTPRPVAKGPTRSPTHMFQKMKRHETRMTKFRMRSWRLVLDKGYLRQILEVLVFLKEFRSRCWSILCRRRSEAAPSGAGQIWSCPAGLKTIRILLNVNLI